MNNKLLKQNATMILYITNFIEQIKSEKLEVKKNRNISCSYKTAFISLSNELIRYFEQCLEEVNKC